MKYKNNLTTNGTNGTNKKDKRLVKFVKFVVYLIFKKVTTDLGLLYITIWAPRQRGKTWVMQRVFHALHKNPQYQDFEVVYLALESLKSVSSTHKTIQYITTDILKQLGLPDITLPETRSFEQVFSQTVLNKPLILVLDEFDALKPEVIGEVVSVFRNIHLLRRNQGDKPTNEKDYLLHGVALIGVRAVWGVENKSGSPFNVQQSVHIPNLTFTEVDSMFKWYERESGQRVEQAVIDQLYYETNGQPGLIGWFGELLTEKYNHNKQTPITLANFEEVYAAAQHVLPDNNILNLISKARQEPYKQTVLEIFKTTDKLEFSYDKPNLNFLYLNGVIDWEQDGVDYYAKFPSPFVQKRLFNYFARELFSQTGQLYDPFDELEDVFTPQGLHLAGVLKRYEVYLQKNRDWMFKNAPRRDDLRVYEAVYHFNFYKYLADFFQSYGGRVWPEFPTGNGKIDIMIEYEGITYGLEVKSFANKREYEKGLRQAADYAAQLGLTKIMLVLFIEAVDDKSRATYEAIYEDTERDIKVRPVFVATGA